MFCIPFKRKVKALLLQIDSYVDAHVTTALQITEAIKSLLSSPAANIITAIIPGDLDNVLQQQAVRALEKLTDALSIVETCRGCDTPEAKLQCFITQLRQYDPHLQDAMLLKLASLLAGALDGDRFKQSLYDTYTQAKYAATKL